MRKELFGNMSTLEIVGEVVGSVLFMVMLVGFSYGVLLVG